MRSLRLGVSLTGLMLAGTALAPASAQVLNLGGATVTNPSLAGVTEVTNGTLVINPGAGSTTIYAGALTDRLGVLALTKGVSGTSTLQLTGSGLNTFSGLTRVTNGVLQAGAINVFSPNSVLNATAAGTFDLFGFNQTSAGLTGPGRVVNTAGGPATLTLATSGADKSFAGDLIGNIRVVKSGTGLQSFVGAKSYTGGTELQSGTLRFSTATSFGAGAIDVTGNASLQGSSPGLTLGNDITLASGAALSLIPNNTTLAGRISGAGSLIKTGNTQLTLSNGANDFSGGVLLQTGQLSVVTGSLGTGTLTTTATQVTLTSASGTSVVINNNIALGGVLNFELPAVGESLTLSGTISGATGNLFLKSGGGTLIVTGNNSFGGNVALGSGFFGFGSDTAAGTGSIIVGTGGNFAAYADNLTIANAIASDHAFDFDTRGNTVTLTGVIADRGPGLIGGLNKVGAGTLNLNAAETYTGATLVAGGRLNINGSVVSDVTVQSGATLGGTGTVAAANSVTVQSGGAISPGTSPGTLTVGNLNLAGGSALNFELATPGVIGGGVNDLIIVTNNLDVAGLVTINPIALTGFDEGTYRLINYGTRSGAGSFTLGGGVTDFTLTLDEATAGQVNLISTFNGTRLWDGNGPYGNGVVNGGDGIWATGTTNWTNLSGNALLAWANTAGIFAGVAGNVTVVGTQGFSSLEFQTAGYVISGGTLQINGSTIDTNNAGITTVNSTIDGANGLTKTGAGTLVLGGNNTYAGGTTVSAGTVRIGSSTAFGTGDVSLASGTTLQGSNGLFPTLANNFILGGAVSFDANGGGTTLDGVISGTGPLAVSDVGPASLSTGLALRGVNTFTGDVSVSNTLLYVFDDSSLGNTANNVALSDAILGFVNSAPVVSTRGLSLTGTGRIVTSSTPVSLNGVVSGTGRLIKDGAGTLTLGNAGNSYAGGTEITAGTVAVATNGALGSLAGGVDFTAGSLAGGNAPTLQFTANVTSARAISIASAVVGTVDTLGNDVTLTGVVSGDGTLAKAGSGRLTLTEANTYTGGTNLTAGTLRIAQTGGIGTGVLTTTGGTTFVAGTALNAAISLAPSNAVVLGTGTTTIDLVGNAFSINTDSGAVTKNGTTLTIDGVISGDGGFVTANAGTLVLNGDNSYSGGTTLGDGVFGVSVLLGNGNGLGTGAVTMNDFTAIQNNSGAALTATNAINIAGSASPAASSIVIGGANDLTLAGALSGAGGLNKAGLGTLTLANAANTNSGTLQVNQGTLNVTGAMTSAAAIVNVRGDATLSGNGSVAGTVNVANAGILSAGDGAAPGTLTLGNLSLGNSSVVLFDLGAADVAGGPLNDRVVVGGALALDGRLTVATSAGGSFGQGIYNLFTYGSLTNNGLILDTLPTLPAGTTASLNFADPGYVNLLVVGAGFEQFWDGDAPGNAHNDVIDGGNGTWGVNTPTWTTSTGALNADWQSRVGTFQGTAGTVNLTSGFSFEQLNFTTGGYVLANGGGGSLVLNGGAVVNTATAPADVTVFNLDVTGTGSLVKQGAGYLDLVAANSYSGGTDIQSGFLRLYQTGSAGTGAINIADGASLDLVTGGIAVANNVTLNGTSTVRVYNGVSSIDGVVSGTGSLFYDGEGTLALTNTNTYTGGTTVNFGTVQFTNNNALSTGDVAINDTATLQSGAAGLALANNIVLSGAGNIDTQAFDLSLDGVLSGTGGFAKGGSGTLTLTNASTYTGATAVNAGNLNVNGSLAKTAVTVASGATLSGTGSIAGSVTILDGGILSPGNSPGTLTVGALTLNNGSILNWEFGAANTVGGALNDLVIVNGDLVLDGLLNVTQSAGGTFGTGIYEIFQYSGNLTDNTLSFGSMLPNGQSGLIQTLVPGQVNLIVTQSPSVVLYWDGADGIGNGVISGGSGVWNAGNTNWTGAPPSALNTNWQSTIGVFQGAAGTVSIEGPQAFEMLQFAVDGYVLNAGAAGELTTAGAGVLFASTGANATINAPINGAGSIVKQGGGTITLFGDNGYAGGTDLQSGTIAVGNNNALGTGTLAMSTGTTLQAATSGVVIGNLITTAGNGIVDQGTGIFTLNGDISGPGSISTVNSGNLVLNGNNSFTNLGIGAGTVTVGTNTAAGIGAIAMASDTTLAAGVSGLVLANAITTAGNGIIDQGTGVFTLNGNIDGAGSISTVNSGNLVLNGNNSFTNLGIGAGTVTVGTNTAAGIGAIAMASDTTLAAGVSGLVLANNITTAGNGIIDQGTGVFTLNGNIDGAGSISTVNSGNLVLNGNNSFTNLGIGAGTVTVGTNTAAGIGGIALASDTTLAAGVSGLVLANNITTAGNGIIDQGTGVFTLNGNIDGAGSISTVNSGNLVLNGNNSFTNLGIGAGTVTVGSNTAAGIGAIALASDTTLAAGVSGLVLANNITTAGNGLIDQGTGIFTLNGDIDGPGSISTVNTGNLVLNGNNSFTNLGIGLGTVTVGTNTAAGIGGIALADNTTLAAGVSGLVLANNITTAGNGIIDQGTGVFTLNGNIDGAGSISTVNSGNLVLNGNNAFTNLGIGAGTVTVGTNTAAGIGGIALASDTTLAAGVSGLVLANNITTAGNGIIDQGTGVFTLNGNIDGAGSISTVNSGNLVLNGNNSFTNLGIGAGTVTVGTNTSAGIGGIALASGTTLAAGVSGLVLANAITTAGNGLIDQGTGVFTLNGNIDGPGSISTLNGGNLVLNGNNSFTNLGIGAGTVTVGSNTAAGISGIALASGTTLAAGGPAITLANNITTAGNGIIDQGTGVFTLNGNIDGPGSISTVNSGNLVLNGNNAFTNLGIGAGTVTVGSNTAAGIGGIALASGTTLAAGGPAVTLANNITTAGNGLIDQGTGVFTLNGNIDGAGSISTLNGGNLVLNGNNAFTNLGIGAGTVTVGSNTAAGIGGIALASGATLAAGGPAITLANNITTAGNGLINQGTGTFTLNGVIDGPGSISTLNGGNLVLNGNNAFTNLGIGAGTVTVGTNTAAGLGGIALASGTTLAAGVSGLVLANNITTAGDGLINQGTGTFTLNGVIDGPGSISTLNGGNLVLNGNNAFTNLGVGAGTVTLGTNTAGGVSGIALASGTTLAAGANNLVIANFIATAGVATIDTGANTMTLSGNINGAGSLTKVGSGVLNLTNTNIYTGGTFINAGTVGISTSTALGTGLLTINSGTLLANANGLSVANLVSFGGAGTIDTAANTLTVTGAVSGSGRITKVGTGTLALGGVNTYTGGLTISAGTVTGAASAYGSGGILNNAALVFNQGVDGTLNQVISGTGTISKIGAGQLTIASVNTITGPTTVTAGRLNVTGSLANSAVTVQTGASLAGTGTVGALTAQSGSTIAPGATVGTAGTLTVNGALNLAAGSTYSVDVTSAGADRITASGTATIAGNLVVTAAPVVTTFNQSYTLLSSSARSGTFSTTTLGNFGPAFSPTIVYDATSVYLRLAPNSLVTLAGPGLTGNALAVANSFDTAVRGGYNPQAFFNLYTQGANLPTALSQLSGELHSAERRVLLEDTRVVREAAFDRLNAGLTAVAGAQTVTTQDSDGKAITVWLRAAGSWGTADADGVGSRFTTDQKGFLTGVDYANNGFKAGGLFHYTSTDVELNSLGKSKVESIGGALYAGYRQEGSGFAVGLGGSIASNKANGSRAITATGLQQSLTSKIDGTTYQIFAEASFDLAKAENTRIEPFGRIAYAKVTSKAFAETGGFAAVSGPRQSDDLTLTTLGLRGSFVTGIATLSGSAGWARTTGDRSASTFLSINGPNTPYLVNTVALDKDAVALEAQASFTLTEKVTLGVGYSGLIGSNNSDHGGRATLTVGF